MVASEIFLNNKILKHNDDLKDFLRTELIPQLELYIKKEEKRPPDDWDGSENKQRHIGAYRKLLGNLINKID